MRRLRAMIGGLVAIAALAVGSVGDEQPTADALAFRYLEFNGSGPLGPITIFGDSVMLGSGITSPTIVDQLAARGWGPIRYSAGGGFNTGTPERAPSAARATWTIQQWRSEGWNPKNIVINLGSNDAGFCGSVECMRGQIEHLLDVIGPGHEIWWPQMTLQPFNRVTQDRWNTALGQIASERDNVHTWNWPGEMAAGPYPSSDNIHLSPDGYRARSARMAQVITARLAEGSRVGTVPALPDPIGPASRFVPVTQQRLADTRTDPAPIGGRKTTGDVLRIELGDTVPEGTTAVALHLAAVRTTAAGFLAAAPCDAAGGTSSVNFLSGTTRGGPAITPVGDDGTVCVRVVGNADVVVDLQGAFHPTDPAGLGFDPLPVPARMIDTREAGRSSEIRLTAPAGAEAVAINLTTLRQAAPGRLIAAPCGTTPAVAALNYLFDPVIASSALVEVGDDGTFCVTSTSPVDVIVDLMGTFGEPAGDSGRLSFVPVEPTRLLDTRDGTGGWSPIHGADQSLDVRVAPVAAEAVTGTLTIVRPLWPAFLSGAPCGADAGTSSVNATTGGVAANALTTGVSGGEVCVTASSGTQSLFDVTGWWVP